MATVRAEIIGDAAEPLARDLDARIAHAEVRLEYRLSFSFSEDEAPFALAVEEEIRRSYPGYEPMNPDVGLTIVPEVATTYQPPGEATLYDCLFTDYR